MAARKKGDTSKPVTPKIFREGVREYTPDLRYVRPIFTIFLTPF